MFLFADVLLVRALEALPWEASHVGKLQEVPLLQGRKQTEEG